MLCVPISVAGVLDGSQVQAALCSGHHACPTLRTNCSNLRSNLAGNGTSVIDTPNQDLPKELSTFAQKIIRSHATGNYTERLRRLMHLRQSGGVWKWEIYDGDFINFKMPIIHAFEHSMQLQGKLWKPGMSLLDVGGGTGAQAAYLAAAYGIHATVYEIPFTSVCRSFLSSPFRVNFFRGNLPVAPSTYDAVSFMNVLHHAAEHTPKLLRQAARIARRWILVTEDLDVINNRDDLRRHDPKGIFRTQDEWRQLFEQEAPDFSLRRSGPVMNRRACVPGTMTKGYTMFPKGGPMICVAKSPHPYLHFFVLERRDATNKESVRRPAHESGSRQ